MNEFNEFPGQHEGSFGEFEGESPLSEILGHEAPMYEGEFEYAHEGEGYEAPYHETFEGPYHEAMESPNHEAPYHEGMFEGETGETGAFEGSWNEVLNEDEVLALTTELLEVQSEAEMDQFLGKLFRRVGSIAKGLINSPIGNLAGQALKNVARTALPLAGKALGTIVGGPFGTMIGGQLADMTGKAFGLELQEMSPQDADFAAARQFVRFAADFLRRAGQQQGGVPPAAAVRSAVTGAARQLAPGLLGQNMPRLRVRPPHHHHRRRGTWVRRGRTIILYGV